jgi:hypothetical protein
MKSSFGGGFDGIEEKSAYKNIMLTAGHLISPSKLQFSTV